MVMEDMRLDGSLFIIFIDFSFSSISFFWVMVLPFLKFIRYIMIEKSFRANAVKKLWSEQVVDMRYSRCSSLLLCLSEKWMMCAGLITLFVKFQIWKSSN